MEKRLRGDGDLGNTYCALSQGRDHVSQGRQRLVDILCLVQHSPFGSGLADLSESYQTSMSGRAETLFPLGRAKPKKREEVGKRIKRDAQPGSGRPFLHSRELSCRRPDHDSIDRLYTIIYMRYSKPEGKPVVCRDGWVGKMGSNHWVIKMF